MHQDRGHVSPLLLIFSIDLSFFKYSNESSSSFYALQSYKFTHELDRFYDEPIKKALSKVTLDQLLDEDSQIFLNDTIREIIKEVGIEEYKNQTYRLPIHREKDKYIYIHFILIGLDTYWFLLCLFYLVMYLLTI